MSLQIRMFGPLTDKKKELHNILTGLGYPIFMDFINRENRQWREDNKVGSFFYYIYGNGTDDWLWVCTNDGYPDLQVTPSADLLGDGADRLLESLLEWLERLLDGDVKIYDQAPPPLT